MKRAIDNRLDENHCSKQRPLKLMLSSECDFGTPIISFKLYMYILQAYNFVYKNKFTNNWKFTNKQMTSHKE